MDNALIDDRRIHVDFSQSVAKLWSQYRRKDQQNGNKKSCFKCGAPDHIAKDCTGSPTAMHQPAKYILKDDNTQRGSESKSRYEMVFDGESGGSPQRNKAHGKFEDERKSRDSRNSDLHDRRRHIDRSTEQGEDERDEGRIHSRSGRDQGHSRREYSKSTDEGSHRDERESKNRSNDRDDRKRHAEIAYHGKRRDERDYKRRSTDYDVRADRTDDRSERKGKVHDSKRDRRDESYGRKTHNNTHGHRSSREERDYEKRNTNAAAHDI